MLFAIAGEAGSVILFVCSGVGVVILASLSIAFAARSYALVVSETAVGLDAVEWPNETPTDWLGQSTGLLFQLLLWIMPAGFLARFLASTWMPDNPPLRFFILMGAAAWLLFPMGLLLSMASVDVGGTVVRLLSSFLTLIVFYVLTALLAIAALGLAYFGLFTAAWYFLPIAALVCPAVLLIHARLLGRIGWLVGRREVTLGNPTKRKKRRRRKALERDRRTATEDDEPIEADEIEPKRSRLAYRDPEPDPYQMADDSDVEATIGRHNKVEIERDEIEREVRLRHREEPPAPRSLFFGGVWEFPLYPTSLRAWVWLIFMSMSTGALVRFMISVSPFGNGP